MPAVRPVTTLAHVPGVAHLDPALTVGEHLREPALLRVRFGSSLPDLLRPRLSGRHLSVQTSPGFLAAIHPYLPMSYLVEGLRRLITGGELAPVWQGSAVVLAFTAGAPVLTLLTARGREAVLMKDMHRS
uniref:Uncharacterized protein n=1 Tax=Streptomyces auratus AGR0001 TaxID=1160718 RepID=J1S159_9ACTN